MEGESEWGMALRQVDRGVERVETAHGLYEEEEYESLAVGRRLLPRGVGRKRTTTIYLIESNRGIIRCNEIKKGLLIACKLEREED